VTPAEHARQRAALAARVRREFRASWQRVDRNAIRASWAAEIPRLLALLTTAQQVAAGTADAYVTAVVGGGAQYEVVSPALAFVASDGRPLETLLQRPAATALSALAGGGQPRRALAVGQFTAELIGHTQTADAGRVADLVAGAAHPEVTGYTRMIVGRTCARCVVLAGRRYSWKANFKRHPKCDCIVIPSSEVVPGADPVSPGAAFRALDRAEQDRVFGTDGAAAIRAGADVAQVVNARSGMRSADGRLFTTTGGGPRPRLMPEQIFREARGDRAEAVRLLSLHGYIRRVLPSQGARS